MAKDDMTMVDVMNVLRCGQIVRQPEEVDGTYRYRVETNLMVVVVAFRSEENGKAKMNPSADRSLRLMVFVTPPITFYPDLHKLHEIEREDGPAFKVRASYSKRKNWTADVDVKALLAARARGKLPASANT